MICMGAATTVALLAALVAVSAMRDTKNSRDEAQREAARARDVPGAVLSQPVDVVVHPTHPAPPMSTWAASRGSSFKQAGFAWSADLGIRLPLYSREAPYHRHRHQYFVGTEDSRVQVSARVGDRDCAAELGCEELFEGDQIHVPEVASQPLTVKLHHR